MGLTAIAHGFATELRLERQAALRDRVSAWYVEPGLIIDAGGAHTASELVGWLAERRVEAAFLGHWHEDHSGVAFALADRGIPVHGSRGTAARLRRRPAVPEYRARLWGSIAPVAVRPARAGAGLRPLPLPGHSPDQLGYLHERSGALFSGDLALRRFQRVAMPGEDPYAMMASMRAVLELGPALLATSHRGVLREWRPFLREQLGYLEDLAARIQDLRRRGLSVRAIVDEVFGGEPPAADGRTWREYSGGEFSAARWVRLFLRGGGAGENQGSESGEIGRPPAGRRPGSEFSRKEFR